MNTDGRELQGRARLDITSETPAIGFWLARITEVLDRQTSDGLKQYRVRYMVRVCQCALSMKRRAEQVSMIVSDWHHTDGWTMATWRSLVTGEYNG